MLTFFSVAVTRSSSFCGTSASSSLATRSEGTPNDASNATQIRTDMCVSEVVRAVVLVRQVAHVGVVLVTLLLDLALETVGLVGLRLDLRAHLGHLCLAHLDLVDETRALLLAHHALRLQLLVQLVQLVLLQFQFLLGLKNGVGSN